MREACSEKGLCAAWGVMTRRGRLTAGGEGFEGPRLPGARARPRSGGAPFLSWRFDPSKRIRALRRVSANASRGPFGSTHPLGEQGASVQLHNFPLRRETRAILFTTTGGEKKEKENGRREKKKTSPMCEFFKAGKLSAENGADPSVVLPVPKYRCNQYLLSPAAKRGPFVPARWK